MTEVMLFPLSSMVLPEGKMRLRIFEPRYQRLVTEASKRDGTFGVCLFKRGDINLVGALSNHGSLVKIVDFETLDDGMLGITVVGIQRFMIQDIRVEADGLRFARIDWLPSWEIIQIGADMQYLGLKLKKIYERFPQIGQLYEQCFFDDASWVSQRWLELLPVDLHQFDYLTAQTDCREAIDYLSSMLIEEE